MKWLAFPGKVLINEMQFHYYKVSLEWINFRFSVDFVQKELKCVSFFDGIAIYIFFLLKQDSVISYTLEFSYNEIWKAQYSLQQNDLHNFQKNRYLRNVQQNKSYWYKTNLNLIICGRY